MTLQTSHITKKTTMPSAGHPSLHDDYVCDVVYDYYGRRFATCSSDHTIRVWDQHEKGQWVITARIPVSWWTTMGVVLCCAPSVTENPCFKLCQAHKSSIAKLSWSFPEFGQVCGWLHH